LKEFKMTEKSKSLSVIGSQIKEKFGTFLDEFLQVIEETTKKEIE